MTASPATELSRSATQRPSTMAAELIGKDRKRSLIPREASAADARVVVSRPKSMVTASMPGMRKSR